LSRALKGRGEFQAAIDVLEIAEDVSSEHTEVIVEYKNEMIAAMKEHLISRGKDSVENNIIISHDKNNKDVAIDEKKRGGESRQVEETKYKIPIEEE
jgi:hypothetical protein